MPVLARSLSLYLLFADGAKERMWLLSATHFSLTRAQMFLASPPAADSMQASGPRKGSVAKRYYSFCRLLKVAPIQQSVNSQVCNVQASTLSLTH